MKPKYLNNKDPWMLAENIPDIDIFFMQLFASAFVNDSSYSFIKVYTKVVSVYKKFELNFYFGEKDSYEVGESIMHALIKRPKFGSYLNKNIMKWSNKLITFAKSLDSMPLETYSNKKLWQIYKKHDDIHTKLYTYGWLPVAADLFHSNMTKNLKQYLSTVCKNQEEVEDAFLVFTTPTKKTVVARDREEFLNIYDTYKKELKGHKKISLNNVSDDFQSALNKHAEKWGHLGYIYAGNHPPFGAQHYLDDMLDLSQTKVNAKKLLEKEQDYFLTAKRKKKQYYKKLKINSLYRNLFETASEFALTKLFRRHTQLFTLLRLHRNLFIEIAKRIKVTRYEVQFMHIREIKESLLTGRVSRKIVKERLKSCVYYTERGFEKIYIKEQARKLSKSIKPKTDLNVSELHGQTAQPGKAKGIVKIIKRAKDMPKMNKGDILVSIATDPDVVPAMKRAGAIVTDMGGITAHAAIVSRELGVPCIIGTKIASKVFKDGDKVEVDATRGIIKRL
jgi:phosphohistidine swiveling domain-containing protein